MLKIGIIGTGSISDAHIEAYRTFGERCEIVALVNRTASKAEACRERHGLEGATVYESPVKMYAAESLDLVSILTPPSTHAELTIEAFEAGVGVVLEKPMAPTLEECDAMLAAQRASGKVLSVVAQSRFRDDMATLKAAVDSGLLGPLSHVQVNSSWWRGLSYYDLWWRGTWESEGGGCTLNHAIHHIDLLLWFMGTPERVTAVMTNAQHENAEVEDLSIAILTYGRALAQITSSVVHHGQEAGIVVQGRNAKVSQPWSVSAEASQPNGFPADHGNEELVAELETLATKHEPLAHTGHVGQIGDVLDAVERGTPVLVSGEDGRNAIELVTAIYKSGIESTGVELPLQPDDPYYRSGTLVERAPRYFAKTASERTQAGEVQVGM